MCRGVSIRCTLRILLIVWRKPHRMRFLILAETDSIYKLFTTICLYGFTLLKKFSNLLLPFQCSSSVLSSPVQCRHGYSTQTKTFYLAIPHISQLNLCITLYPYLMYKRRSLNLTSDVLGPSLQSYIKSNCGQLFCNHQFACKEEESPSLDNDPSPACHLEDDHGFWSVSHLLAVWLTSISNHRGWATEHCKPVILGREKTLPCHL